MHIKNIFILNASINDQLKVDGRVMKARGAKVPEKQTCFDSLRVTFLDNAERLIAMGYEERIDLLFIDVDRLRDNSVPLKYNILGRRKPVFLELS